MYEALCCVMMVAIIIWCVASLVLLVKIWPAFRWSIKLTKEFEPFMQKYVEAAKDLLSEEETTK